MSERGRCNHLRPKAGYSTTSISESNVFSTLETGRCYDQDNRNPPRRAEHGGECCLGQRAADEPSDRNRKAGHPRRVSAIKNTEARGEAGETSPAGPGVPKRNSFRVEKRVLVLF